MMTDDNEWLMKTMTLGDGDGDGDDDGWTMMDDAGLWWMMLDEDGWRWMRMMMIMIFESLKIKEAHFFLDCSRVSQCTFDFKFYWAKNDWNWNISISI